MKKTILALLVLLTAALVFTGCPKEPDMPETPATPNLDGTWIASFNMPAGTTLLGSYEAFTAYYGKLVISGNTYKSYETSADYDEALMYYMMNLVPAPEAEWSETPVSEGAFTISGKTLTFAYDDGTSSTATLSDDNKSLVSANPDYDPEDPDLGPETITFVKQ